MSDLQLLEHRGAALMRDVIGWVRGQKTAVSADAAALSAVAIKVGNGLRGAAPDAPGLVADCEALIAAGAAVAASRGANLPALEAAAAALRKGYQDLEKAYSDYVAGTTLIASVSPTTSLAPSK